ncbi:MAG: hypothetical protein C0599_08435 [Salinivirgaceae bacterium]|nr:MAG: hypothetical protein C0599_08435 [Salinivirgaceae bacterium]
MLNENVDLFLEDGCGRCSYYKSPKCKVIKWTDELAQLRRIVLECGLKEEFKWSQPTYTYDGKNILMVTALMKCAVLSFFKGVLLKDEQKLLISAGENSQAVRQFRFTNVEDILKIESAIKEYVFEAVEVEKAGLKIEYKQRNETIPDELKQMMDENQTLKIAFESLTPGRQRGYILYFSQAKKSETRYSRIMKYIPHILSGRGLNDI